MFCPNLLKLFVKKVVLWDGYVYANLLYICVISLKNWIRSSSGMIEVGDHVIGALTALQDSRAWKC